MVRPWSLRSSRTPSAAEPSAAAVQAVAALNIQRNELTEVYCPDNPKVDIVLVHGLNGHPQTTWTAKNGVFWPTQLLPKTLGNVRARILVYGYNADVYAFGGKSATADYILQHAQTLVFNLDSERYTEDASDRPIIFVAHSLGGILVKKALDYSSEISTVNNENLRSIFVSTYGIVFLGTPHNGADPAKWGLMLQAMASALLPRLVLDTEPGLVAALKTQSETLQNINVSFSNMMEKFHVAFFHEALKTDFGVFKDFVVDQTSAAPVMPGAAYAGIEATHSGICKYESKNSPGYTPVASIIKRWAQDAPSKIANRWVVEREQRRQAKQFAANELTGHPLTAPDEVLGPGVSNPSTTLQTGAYNTPSRLPALAASALTSPSAPLFEDVYTVEEIKDQEKSIPNLQASTDGAGNSTTQLAITAPTPSTTIDEPLFIAPAGFRPNALFVGMDRELAELDERLFDPQVRGQGAACVLLSCISGGGKSHVARQYAYTRRARFPGGIFWVRAKSKSQIAQGFWDIAQKAALTDVQDPRVLHYEQDTEVFIKAVKAWFEQRQEWLLVFDGIAIDSEEEMEGLQAFLPDTKNSSLILTSVDRSLVGRHRLLNPASIRVAPLSEEDACRLLFLELNMPSPTPVQVLKAHELVDKVDCLPLAIHAIGHRVRATKEPLVKYHIRQYSSADPRLREPFIEIMDDLKRLEHYEARNLVYLLAFYRENIPVELIQLGVKGLRPFHVEVKARHRGSRRDLNTTFSILMRYALIDRNEVDDTSQSASTSFPETIDTLKIHGVVQTFLAETLKAEGQLSRWIMYAVKVFVYSLAEADGRIQRGHGLVKDYRWYEVHGSRLMEHVERNIGKNVELEAIQRELSEALLIVTERIQENTPNSSQESVDGPPVRVSVFDRTSSSSSAGPETPHDSTQDLLPWKFRVSEPQEVSVETPGMDTPRPELLSRSPKSAFALEDAGYLSDLEQSRPSRGMTPTMSQTTVRGVSRYASSDEDDTRPVGARMPRGSRSKENQLPPHRTLSARQRRRYRDSVSAWRQIAPTYSDPRVTKVHVQNRPRPWMETGGRRGSEAEQALAAFDAGFAHPPSTAPNPIEAAPTASPTASPQRPSGSWRRLPAQLQSYADFVTGRSSRSAAPTDGDSASSPRSASSPTSSGLIQDRPGARGRSPHGEERHASPLAMGRSAHQLASHSASPGSGHGVVEGGGGMHSTRSSPGARYPDPMLSSDPDLRVHRTVLSDDEHDSMGWYGPVGVQGRNPLPLLREDVSVPSKRPLPPAFRGQARSEDFYRNQQSMSMHNMPATSEYTLSSGVPVRPYASGYTSQPMSRDGSDHTVSHQSVADTEPARFPPQFSPLAGPSPISPRERFHDGAPAFKSAKVQSLAAEAGQLSPLDATPRTVSNHDLAAMGGWASPAPETAMSMSRSSSGPGIATQGALVRFGESEAVEADLDALRAAQHRERLQRAIEKGEFRPLLRDRRRAVPPGVDGSGGMLPYPDISHMPRTSGAHRSAWDESMAIHDTRPSSFLIFHSSVIMFSPVRLARAAALISALLASFPLAHADVDCCTVCSGYDFTIATDTMTPTAQSFNATLQQECGLEVASDEVENFSSFYHGYTWEVTFKPMDEVAHECLEREIGSTFAGGQTIHCHGDPDDPVW
ncbi:MAG: hypothetical protein M1838_002248 [Thelocarpon superellum]|nr:MAG: hypothetical protein M1838_002248 [Thelocarpon superellum]